MLNKQIEKALEHSPRHAGLIREAMLPVDRRNVAMAAAVVRKKCAELRLVDFPNPFAHGTTDHKTWHTVFNAKDVQIEDGDVLVDEVKAEAAPASDGDEAANEVDMPDFAAMTKAEIRRFIGEKFSVDMTVSWKSKPVIVKEAEKIWAEHAA